MLRHSYIIFVHDAAFCRVQLIINPRNAEAKDLSINNPLSQEVEVSLIIDLCQSSVTGNRGKSNNRFTVCQSSVTGSRGKSNNRFMSILCHRK